MRRLARPAGLHLVAQRPGVLLGAVLERFRDAIADGWFARTLGAMVLEPDPGLDLLPPSARVHLALRGRARYRPRMGICDRSV